MHVCLCSTLTEVSKKHVSLCQTHSQACNGSFSLTIKSTKKKSPQLLLNPFNQATLGLTVQLRCLLFVLSLEWPYECPRSTHTHIQRTNTHTQSLRQFLPVHFRTTGNKESLDLFTLQFHSPFSIWLEEKQEPARNGRKESKQSQQFSLDSRIQNCSRTQTKWIILAESAVRALCLATSIE